MIITDRPSWIADAIFYQIFPDRFAKSDIPKPTNLEPWDSPPTPHGYKGGDLGGVVDHLDWLSDLGVNAIYFNPIFRSASNHRYHTHDYYSIDPLLGGEAAFDRLLAECERRRIRIVLDGVFNHASRGFFQFNDILENGAQSPWLDWFKVRQTPVNAYSGNAPNYAAWWNNPALPQLNTANPSVREFLMGIAEHWIRRGIHGWRLDVPEEIETEGFWEEMRQRVRAIDSDAYIVGEVWTPAVDWIGDGSRFDGVMNYPMTEANLRFAAAGRIDDDVTAPVNLTLTPPLDAAGYADVVAEHLQLYPWDAHTSNLNLLGSHDTARALSMVGGDADSIALAATLMLTFPGAPCIYYGDEIGLQGGHDPGCRAGFPWDRPDDWNRDLLRAFRDLIAVRASQPVLRQGQYRILHSAGDLYVFSRETDAQGVVVAVNAGNESAGTTLDGITVGDRLWGEGSSSEPSRVSVPGRRATIWSMTR
jgi:glycosidase